MNRIIAAFLALALCLPSLTVADALGTDHRAVSAMYKGIGRYEDILVPEKVAGLADVEYIRTHEYENTFWKRLWNTVLLAISREALNKGLPWNGYALTKVQDRLCAIKTPFLTEPLGNTIALVRKSTTYSADQPVYEGFRLIFNPKDPPFGALADACAWLTLKPARAFQYLKATNLPPGGTWVTLDTAEHALPDDVVPVLKAHPELSGSDATLFNRWSLTDGQHALTWQPLDAPDDATLVARKQDQNKVWSYEVGDEPTGIYLTYDGSDTQAAGIETWKSASGTFGWHSPPSFTPGGHHLVAWASPKARSPPPTRSTSSLMAASRASAPMCMSTGISTPCWASPTPKESGNLSPSPLSGLVEGLHEHPLAAVRAVSFKRTGPRFSQSIRQWMSSSGCSRKVGHQPPGVASSSVSSRHSMAPAQSRCVHTGLGSPRPLPGPQERRPR